MEKAWQRYVEMCVALCSTVEVCFLQEGNITSHSFCGLS